MFGFLRKQHHTLWWSGIALMAIGAAICGYEWSIREHRKVLADDALRCARILLAGERRAVREGETGPTDYARLPERLQELQVVRPKVLSLAVVRLNRGEEQTLARIQISPRNGPFRRGEKATIDTIGSRLLVQAHRQQSVSEGPVSDEVGTWAAGFALLGEQAGLDGSEGSYDVFVLLVAADEWTGEFWAAAAMYAVAAAAISGLPLMVFLLIRRYSSQETKIHALSEAVEQSQSAILIVNTEGLIEYVNLGMCLQMGYGREEMVGRRWIDFLTAPVPAGFFSEIVVAVRGGLPWEGDWSHQRKNGERYPAHGSVSPVLAADKTVVGCIAVINDRTAQQKNEEALHAAKEQAEAGDKSKGQFLATMSHEVRTPLNGIVGFASLLLDTALTSEQREYVHTIRTSADALIHLTGDILDYSRIESGGLQLENAPCDLRACVEDALDIFASKAGEKRIELLHWVEPDVPLQAVVDAGRLRQVIINLIGNAIKFTPSGEVEVAVRVLTGKAASVAPFDLSSFSDGQMIAEFDDGSLTLEFSIRDTGIGISSKDWPKLFQPFSQLDATSMRRYGGAGLGLAISRNLVRLMRGEIWLQSEPGRGSTFYFTVRGRPLPDEHGSPASGCLAGKKVAIATASPGLRRELTQLLFLAGAQTRMCAPDDLDFSAHDLILVDTDLFPAEGPSEFINKKVKGWQSERAFGLVQVATTAAQRQALRPHFRILLNKPVHHFTVLDLLTRAAGKVGGTNPPHAGRSTRGLRVLLVDDDEVNQRLMEKVLEHLGCRWQAASNGRGCAQALLRDSFDVVLMDIHMPEMDGLTATRQIRAGEAGEAAKTKWVIVVTGDDRSELREMAYASGANDFLRKPVTLVDTESALLRFLDERRKQQGRPSSEDVVSINAI